MTPEEIKRGEAARTILEDPLFREILLKLEKDVFSKWCIAEDEKTREALWYEQKAVKGLLTRLRTLVQDVEYAKR